MPSKTRFGIFLPQIFSWEQIKQEASLIEALGFESLWIADHFVSLTAQLLIGSNAGPHWLLSQLAPSESAWGQV